MKPCRRGHARGRNRSGTCRDCVLIAVTKYRCTEKGHRMYLRARRKYVQRNKTQTRIYDRNYKMYNKEQAALYKRKQTVEKYGITEADYERMYTAQNGCCAICKKHSSNFKRRLNIDHNHKTGQVRGLLCYRCNKFVVGRHTYQTALNLVEYLKVEADFQPKIRIERQRKR